MNNSEIKYLYSKKICISEIVFGRETDVTIFEYVHTNIIRYYVCDFGLLNDLLMCADEIGKEILKVVADKLEKAKDPIAVDEPFVIKLCELLGEGLHIENILLKVYRSDDTDVGECDQAFEKDDVLIIEEITRKNLNYIDEEDEENEGTSRHLESIYEKQLEDYLSLLGDSYINYIELRKIELSEKEARRMAGLSNEILFRMASLCYKL